MNKHQQLKPIAILLSVLWLGCLSVAVYADSARGGVSYSPEHWPQRWSSAIRQQQDGRFPTREKPQTPPPKQYESVSEQDLFYMPTERQGYGYEHRQDRFEDRQSRHRYLREAHRLSRDAAYAYHDMYPMYGNMGGFGGGYAGYGGFPYGTAPLGIDPVLGSPGIGIPIMPGTPYGFPYGGYPGVGFWNPPFGAW